MQRFERFADSCEQQLRKLSGELSRVEQDLVDAYADLAAYTELHDHFRAARHPGSIFGGGSGDIRQLQQTVREQLQSAAENTLQTVRLRHSVEPAQTA